MLQEIRLGCRNEFQQKDRYQCVFVSAGLPLSPGEQSDPEMHTRRCPLWRRRRPHSSEKEEGAEGTLDAD